MKKPLVSVITPCYNGEKVMHRMLRSILSQTYSPIEFILVNDGSTDNSEQIWREFEPLFDQKGIKHTYIYQENQGLGGAINSGLKVFTGDYLCWPDIDDILDDTSIEKRVSFLESNTEFGSVSSDANCYSEDDLCHPTETVAGWMTHIQEEWQFRHMLSGQSIYCSGCHMLRTSCFLDVNPDRQIYPARRGQNNQMLLPIYYKYKRGFIDEPLYHYIIYKKSMSTPDTSRAGAVNRIEEYVALLKATLQQIPLDSETAKFSDLQLRRIEWDGFSQIYVECGEPINLLRLYWKLKIYQTDQKKEIIQILPALKNTVRK